MTVDRQTVGAIATVVVALVGVLLFSVGQADASFVGFGHASNFGSFENTESIAVNELTGDVYVYDQGRGTISKFDASGDPVDFTALGENVITGASASGSNQNELAVDSSAGPASGDIYLADGSVVKIFGPDGKALGELTEASGQPWGEACGVAVDRTGHVYVGLNPSHVNEYTPTADPVADSDYTTSLAGLNEVCNVAVDPEGTVYADTLTFNNKGPIVKYDASQFGQSRALGALVVPEASGTLAVANSPGEELFVNGRELVNQYDVSGGLLSTFGANEAQTQYYAVAFNAKNGKLYVAERAVGRVEIWQGAVVPTIQTDQATDTNASGEATLNGRVSPEEISVEACTFEYGTSASYGSIASCAQTTPLTGDGTVPVSASLSNVLLNHVYHYRLTATDGQGVLNGADRTFAILVPPTVEDQAPVVSSITRASATLTATINPEQGNTRYRFEYGPTEDYGYVTSTLDTGDEILGDTSVSRQLGDLLPDRAYHYRIVAENLAGKTIGADHDFVTSKPTPATAVTGGSNGVTQNSATIEGAVDTNGLPATYGFEIGTSTDYGPATGLGSVGAGLSETPVSLVLTGLEPGTTYHYRFTATNVDGTSYGADQTFTTGVFTNTFATPPPPLPFVAVPSIVFPGEAKSTVVKKKTAKTKGKKVKKRGKAKGKKAKHKKKK